MIHSLAEYNPISALFYKWNYSYEELVTLYKQKAQEYIEKRKADYKFLIELTNAALGGKKDKGYSIDTGEGLEGRTEEDDAALREALGNDYDRVVLGK